MSMIKSTIRITVPISSYLSDIDKFWTRFFPAPPYTKATGIDADLFVLLGKWLGEDLALSTIDQNRVKTAAKAYAAAAAQFLLGKLGEVHCFL